MGKRKRSKSRDCDYDTILRKVKKLEQKLKKKQNRQRLLSSESEHSYLSANDADLSDVPLDEAACLQDDENCSLPHRDSAELVTEADTGDANAKRSDDAAQPPLEPEILELLGEDPSNQKSYGDNLHKDIAPRWTYILTNGLRKDTQSELVKRYLPPENCPNMRAPKLNLEIKAALLEATVKKDLYSQSKQNQLASSLSAIARVLNWTLESKSTVPQDIIQSLSDAGRLMCDSHFRESMSRRYSALNTLNKNIRDTIKNTKIDEHLFGSSLSEHIKSSKAITKAGSELKPPSRPTYKTPPATQPQRSTLNSRGAPRAAVAEPRSTPAPRRPTRDRRQDATRGRRSTGYTRQQTRKR